jgi:hypothetical protein
MVYKVNAGYWVLKAVSPAWHTTTEHWVGSSDAAMCLIVTVPHRPRDLLYMHSCRCILLCTCAGTTPPGRKRTQVRATAGCLWLTVEVHVASVGEVAEHQKAEDTMK